MNFQSILNATSIDNNTGYIELPEDWQQGRSMFGGLQVALLINFLEKTTHIKLEHLKGLQVAFIEAVTTDKLTLTYELLRDGNTQFYELTLQQNNTCCCRVFAMLGQQRDSSISINNLPYPNMRPYDDIEDLPFLPGITPNFTQHFHIRLAQGDFPFTNSKEDQANVYLKHRSLTTQTIQSIIALADVPPSPALAKLKKPSPISSAFWTLEFFNLKSLDQFSDWVLLENKILFAEDGSAAQRGTLWCADTKMPILITQQVVSIYEKH